MLQDYPSKHTPDASAISGKRTSGVFNSQPEHLETVPPRSEMSAGNFYAFVVTVGGKTETIKTPVDVAKFIASTLWDEKVGPVGFKIVADGNTYEQSTPLETWKERACISNLARSAELICRGILPPVQSAIRNEGSV